MPGCLAETVPLPAIIPETVMTMQSPRSSRREFLSRSIATGAAILFVPDALSAISSDLECTTTKRDLYGLGPFHERNAPFRMSLVGPGEPGQRLTITGRVTGRDCVTPLENVVIDVWGANNAGCYTEIDANGQLTDSCTPRASDPYNLRGRLRTNSYGIYGFTTIVPGRYLNGSRYRPSHLHFIITPDGGPDLITQLYFEGDPYIPGDLGASDINARNRIIPLSSGDEGLAGRFDIVLDVDAPSGVDARHDMRTSNALTVSGENPFVDATAVQYNVSATGRADVMVFDVNGRYVRTLVDAVHMPGRYVQRWDGLDASGARAPSGAYVLRLRTSTSVASVSVVRY